MASIAEIARISGMHRPTVYETLPRLEEKGLVTSVPEGKRKLYLAESPSRLKALKAAQDQDFASTIEELENLHSSSDDHIDIKLLRGKEAMRTALKEQMQEFKKNATYYRYDAYDGDVDYLSYRPKDYARVRDEKNWGQFCITNKTLRQKPFKKRMNCATKVFPPDIDAFEYNIEELIYNDTVIFADFDTNTSIVIKNKRFAEFQKRLFKTLYDQLPANFQKWEPKEEVE